ncbi:hydroxymethylglutaryl-CoA lyase [Hufsiella ginkgonis]|uniref:Hydroxymethylglutaryl-CoA lyase n=1 Tax=Hufsiella ginkgonis TaxID=2695274 RepID=A0A7K1XYD8_9SPHI|nr:hydroxymethylglutaryl-CoA lyase [Hufsiella ginkgonis]MXV15857.1 hydroxymethylglutaryl-CoA lyase [Hufsiella ginkgonis]
MKLVECPRDAMQGLHEFIPTDLKASYINLLLQVGFDTLDFGSFVSPKAIPQMRDTAGVLSKLDLSASSTKLLAIVANLRGIEEAVQYDEIIYLGFPFSISETFQQRNTNSGIRESLVTVEKLVELAARHHKTPVIYLSMAFGNPYGDAWNIEIAEHWAAELVKRGVVILSLADTVGSAQPGDIETLFSSLAVTFPAAELGVHLHSTPASWREKIDAAYSAGCRRFDSALKGYGGCPMASDVLTGNIATENLLAYLAEKKDLPGINYSKWQEAMDLSGKVFLR